MANPTQVEEFIAKKYKACGQILYWPRSILGELNLFEGAVMSQLRTLQKEGKLVSKKVVYTRSGRAVWRGPEAEYAEAKKRSRNFWHETTDEDPIEDGPSLEFSISPSWRATLDARQ